MNKKWIDVLFWWLFSYKCWPLRWLNGQQSCGNKAGSGFIIQEEIKIGNKRVLPSDTQSTYERPYLHIHCSTRSQAGSGSPFPLLHRIGSTCDKWSPIPTWLWSLMKGEILCLYFSVTIIHILHYPCALLLSSTIIQLQLNAIIMGNGAL